MNFYDYISEKVRNKSVLILGLGREGISTLKLLSKINHYSKIAVADMNECALNNIGNEGFINKIAKHYGADYLDSINSYDIIFKSPGVVLKNNAALYKITGQMQCFVEYFREQIIGITGTKGKSTTSSLIYHELKENGIDTAFAGNIGVPVFEIVDDISPNTQIVIEMSCHQLEYMTVSPKTAILLNLYEEHLDHYGTFEKYCKAKYNIFKHMLTNDTLISTSQLKNKKNELELPVSTIFAGFNDNSLDINITEAGFYNNNKLIKIPENISLLGIHNIYNIACVYKITEKYGICYDDFIKSLKSFNPLPHRLEFVGKYHNIDFYDDSISTMGEATISAIKSVKNAHSVLIGGMDRGIDYSRLIDFINENSQYLYILMEATGNRIYEEIKAKNNINNIKITDNIIPAKHLEDAVDIAFSKTKSGMACILSPAAASYGIFKNFEHRGDVFKEMIKSK